MEGVKKGPDVIVAGVQCKTLSGKVVESIHDYDDLNDSDLAFFGKLDFPLTTWKLAVLDRGDLAM